MKVDYVLYQVKDSCSVNKGHYVESNESVSISLSHDYTTHWRRGWTCNRRPSRPDLVQTGFSLQPQIQRLAWRLHQYSFRIQHIAGTANTADSLSRLPSKQNDCSDTGFVCESYVRFVYMSNMSGLPAVTLSDMRSETSLLKVPTKLSKMSRCPNYLTKFKTENGHAILILNRIAA